MKLSTQTAMAVFKAIAKYLPGDFDMLGITEENLKVVTGDNVWLRPQMHNILKTINSVIYGTTEIMGLPKIVVPAEYIAAVICAFVHPCNIQTCCIWMAQEHKTGVAAMQLAARGEDPQSMEQASADQLFALCNILMESDKANWAREQFAERIGIEVIRAEEQGT